jgi:amino acid transporter
MKSLVIGLLAALALAVLGIVLLQNDEAADDLVWLLAAFVALDLVALLFAGVAGLWNVRRRAWRRPVRAVLLSAYLGITVVGYLYTGSAYARAVAEYDPSDECRVLIGSCTPQDGRIPWIVLSIIFGLLSWTAARLHARWRRERYWYANQEAA